MTCCSLSFSKISSDIPHIALDKPGGVGVGLTAVFVESLFRNRFSAASTRCKVEKVRMVRI